MHLKRRTIMNMDIRLEIASLILEGEAVYLNTNQTSYLEKGFNQLPKWCQNIIYQHVNNGAWSDEYSELGKERLKKAIETAQDVISTDILTLGKMPLSKLLKLADADTDKTYDEITKTICDKAGEKFMDPYVCNEVTLRDFRHEETEEEASLAILDCDTMLSQVAFAGELASFRHAIVKKFPNKFCIGKKITSYAEAIETIAQIAREESYKDLHYRKAVAWTIVAFMKQLEKRMRNGEDALIARKHILFEMLPIDASIKDIGWAINEDWINLELNVKFVDADTRRNLLYLGYRKIEDLIVNPVDSKHAELKQAVEESLKYIFG